MGYTTMNCFARNFVDQQYHPMLYTTILYEASGQNMKHMPGLQMIPSSFRIGSTHRIFSYAYCISTRGSL